MGCGFSLTVKAIVQATSPQVNSRSNFEPIAASASTVRRPFSNTAGAPEESVASTPRPEIPAPYWSSTRLFIVVEAAGGIIMPSLDTASIEVATGSALIAEILPGAATTLFTTRPEAS